MIKNIQKILSLENLFLFTIFLMPVYLIRFSIGGLKLNVLDSLFLILIVLKLTKQFEKIKINRKAIQRFKQNFKLNNFKIPTSLILIGVILSAWQEGFQKKELGILKSWFILPLFILVIFKDDFNNPNFKEKIFKVWLASSVGVTGIALIYKVQNWVTYDNRLKAFFSSPNYLAMYLAPGIIIAYFYFFQKKYYKLAFFTLVLTLYWTFSYGAWLGIASSLILVELGRYYFRKNKNKLIKNRLNQAIVSVLILVFLAFFLQTSHSKWNNLIHWSKRSSENSRLMIWRSAWKIGKDNWLWGIGPGNFQEKYLNYQKYFPLYLEWAVPQPHNLYLAFWLQTGLIGFLGFLILLFLFFKKIIAKIKKPQNLLEKRITLINATLMLYWLIHGLVDTPYWKNDLALMFWVVVIMVFSENKKQIRIKN